MDEDGNVVRIAASTCVSSRLLTDIQVFGINALVLPSEAFDAIRAGSGVTAHRERGAATCAGCVCHARQGAGLSQSLNCYGALHLRGT